MFLAEVAAENYTRLETHQYVEQAEEWIARIVCTIADRFPYICTTVTDIPSGEIIYLDEIADEWGQDEWVSDETEGTL